MQIKLNKKVIKKLDDSELGEPATKLIAGGLVSSMYTMLKTGVC
ncbi:MULTISPECIES: hypothetical protein [unclassified Pseudoalteromonas]|nr:MULTISPECIES: hypothetical protein [unclassified Pseudoalteromonas]